MKKIGFIIGLIILIPLIGKADIIFFKDGMKTVCQGRAWHEGQEVKCEYEGVVLSYQKNDVFRIQKVKAEKKIDSPADQDKIPAKPAPIVAAPSLDTKSTDSQAKPPAKKESKIASNKKIKASKPTGLEFYNPRRPQKYWTGPTAKHQTFDAAIAALSKQYNRSPQWIRQQMGETNDLDVIHRNLADSKLNAPAEPEAVSVKKTSDTLFYNPRRPYKYWTSNTAKHKTLKQAIAALSAEYDRSAQWVQQHMGESNNLSEIHQNLKKQKLSEASP